MVIWCTDLVDCVHGYGYCQKRCVAFVVVILAFRLRCTLISLCCTKGELISKEINKLVVSKSVSSYSNGKERCQNYLQDVSCGFKTDTLRTS